MISPGNKGERIYRSVPCPFFRCVRSKFLEISWKKRFLGPPNCNRSCRSDTFKKSSQLRRRPELWDRIEFLERRCECVRQAPHGPGLEFLVLRIEVELVYLPCQVLRDLQITFDECPVDRQLCRRGRQLFGSPTFHLPLSSARSSAASGQRRSKVRLRARSVSSV